MCTAATYKTNDFYFGRNLDYEFSYGESVTVTPRNYEFKIHCGDMPKTHYAIIGMAHISEDYPLYYDAANEKGLCAAGLNFVGNAYFGETLGGRENVAQYEFIPWVLSKCATVKEAVQLLTNANITNNKFLNMPPAQLHWLIADKDDCITVESVKEGLKLYSNPVGVLTNNPPFMFQMAALDNYMALSPKNPVNTFSDIVPLKAYSRGMGALGLPGDASSQSRFVRAAFVKLNSRSGADDKESISQFFHILGSVEQQRGCTELENGKYEITIYSSCINASRGIYCYKTYNNSRINAVDMHREKLDGSSLISYPITDTEDIKMIN